MEISKENVSSLTCRRCRGRSEARRRCCRRRHGRSEARRRGCRRRCRARTCCWLDMFDFGWRLRRWPPAARSPHVSLDIVWSRRSESVPGSLVVDRPDHTGFGAVGPARQPTCRVGRRCGRRHPAADRVGRRCCRRHPAAGRSPLLVVGLRLVPPVEWVELELPLVVYNWVQKAARSSGCCKSDHGPYQKPLQNQTINGSGIV